MEHWTEITFLAGPKPLGTLIQVYRHQGSNGFKTIADKWMYFPKNTPTVIYHQWLKSFDTILNKLTN